MQQQTNDMRLEKMELSNFFQFKEKQGIGFSKDNRITIIQGENGSGKTTLFKAMKAGLGLEKHDEEYGQPQLKCNFDPAVINNENQFLFFQDGENLREIQHDNFLKFGTDPGFLENVRTLFLKHSHKSRYLDITYNSGKIYMITENNKLYQPAMTEEYELSICILIALKQRLYPNSFLVFDAPFHFISQESKNEMCHMLLENVSQLILLVTNKEYEGKNLEDEFSEETNSVKNIINNLNPAVSEYRLVTNENQTKIEKCL
jgi:hypothetical protein